MNIVFKDMLGKGVHVYLDDLLISAETMEEHMKLLKEVFRRLRESNLKLKVDKTSFFRKEVEYLGHIISYQGTRPNEK